MVGIRRGPRRAEVLIGEETAEERAVTDEAAAVRRAKGERLVRRADDRVDFLPGGWVGRRVDGWASMRGDGRRGLEVTAVMRGRGWKGMGGDGRGWEGREGRGDGRGGLEVTAVMRGRGWKAMGRDGRPRRRTERTRGDGGDGNQGEEEEVGREYE